MQAHSMAYGRDPIDATFLKLGGMVVDPQASHLCAAPGSLDFVELREHSKFLFDVRAIYVDFARAVIETSRKV